MENVIWIVIMLPISLLFTGLGIYAWRRKKPMWFRSGSTVKESEIADIPAYNRANGIMWIAYSSVFWLGSILGAFDLDIAGWVLAVGCLGGIPILVIAYRKIYNKYRRSAEKPRETIHVETVETDSFSMNYFKFGSGARTLVIIPGLSVQGVMGSAEQVAEAYRAVSEDFTVYVFDPQNELPDSVSIAELADNTVKAMKTLGLGRVCIMGASMGGMIAMEIAARYPESVEKTVLASTAVQVKEAQLPVIEKWISLAKEKNAEGLYLAFGEAVYPKAIFEQSRGLLVEASKSVTEAELNRFIILAGSVRGFDITGELDSVKCPVFAVCDREDRVLGAQAVRAMETCMAKRSEWDFYLYDGYGHALYDTAPDFKERMLDFLL